MLKHYFTGLTDATWAYSSWVCCKCREPNEKERCWKCGHVRCDSCQDGW